MIFFAHIGPSAWLARRLGSWLAPETVFDLKALTAVSLCAILPDIVDKPFFYLGLYPAHTGRLWGHTLLFSLAWCLACRFRLKALWPWALATPGHLILDGMWDRPHTLAWPVLGNYFDEPPMYFPSHKDYWVWLYHNDPLVLAGLVLGDLTGLVLFAAAAWPLAAPALGRWLPAAARGRPRTSPPR